MNVTLLAGRKKNNISTFGLKNKTIFYVFAAFGC